MYIVTCFSSREAVGSTDRVKQCPVKNGESSAHVNMSFIGAPAAQYSAEHKNVPKNRREFRPFSWMSFYSASAVQYTANTKNTGDSFTVRQPMCLLTFQFYLQGVRPGGMRVAVR